MSILDKLRKKRPEKIEKPEIKKERPKIKKTAKKKTKKKVSDWANKILKDPHVTEKAGDLAKQNQYIFKVFPKANKIEIKKAIEQTYKVNVLKIGIINVPRKTRSFGKTPGWKKGYKKAVVRIKEGQKIDVISQ